MELFIAVTAAGATPETTGLRNVTFQRLSGAEAVTVVLETVGVIPTGVADAVTAGVSVETTTGDGVAVGPWVDGGRVM
jgi:hypothetical protein